ncbi:hypothetical protein Y032_0009g811 [Ancylostoma ceylanicum]|nr:hypothetical protein Y032_0009g811 [Ancylostoma ceylanicum]
MTDIRWDILQPFASNSASKLLVELCKSHSLIQHVNGDTLKENTLDLVLSSDEGPVGELKVDVPVGTSDQRSVNIQLKLSTTVDPCVVKRDFNAANFADIRNYLYNVDRYGSLDMVNSVDGQYELFIRILYHCIDLSVALIKAPINASKDAPSYQLNSSR